MVLHATVGDCAGHDTEAQVKFIGTILFAVVVGLFIMWLISEIATQELERPLELSSPGECPVNMNCAEPRAMEERANPPN